MTTVRAKRVIGTDDAPAAVGTYGQAPATDGLLLTAGQLPLADDATPLDEAIAEQIRQRLETVAAILEAERESRERAHGDRLPWISTTSRR